ncbi:MAG: aminopeptidase P family protein [Defluviitaleaceae bacterium]|nr:aminopeptidase P family protein [Defluviitaleaceae bacterium]
MIQKKIASLRALMAERGVDAYVIFGGDDHASEYAAGFWRAREWLSGFTGSMGILVVTRDEAGLWTDGRYFIQAEKELRGSGIKIFRIGEPDVPTYRAFLARKIPDGGTLGFDGRTLMVSEFSRIKEAFREEKILEENFLEENSRGKKINFAYDDDLVGILWRDRPPLPREKSFAHPPRFAGKTSAEKLRDVRAKMKEKNFSAYLVTALDSVAWLLNIRGRDIKNLPVAYAFALVTETEAHVFADENKIPAPQNFFSHDYDALPAFLKNFSTRKLFFNPDTTNVLLANETKNIAADDIITLLKAVKTESEIANIKNAFVKEGVAMTKLLCRIDTQLPKNEGEVVRAMQKFRAEQADYLCESFATIAAFGENAAQAHYNSGETGADLRREGFLLIDTGGQYLDGTTDTTRTVCLGEISPEMRRDFTLVLKGHIALATAVFLSGTTGTHLDILARAPLWRDGKNYAHGTGHGVGYCLSVHEGPQNISRAVNSVALVPGMLITNEPAFYKENEYGIRTENVLLVVEKEKRDGKNFFARENEKEKRDGNIFFAFENLTFCPIDKRAIAPELLTEAERDWLNDYHKRTFEMLSPFLRGAELEWLKNATSEL